MGKKELTDPTTIAAKLAATQHSQAVSAFSKAVQSRGGDWSVKTRDTGGCDIVSVEHDGQTYEFPLAELKKEDLSPY